MTRLRIINTLGKNLREIDLNIFFKYSKRNQYNSKKLNLSSRKRLTKCYRLRISKHKGKPIILVIVWGCDQKFTHKTLVTFLLHSSQKQSRGANGGLESTIFFLVSHGTLGYSKAKWKIKIKLAPCNIVFFINHTKTYFIPF